MKSRIIRYLKHLFLTIIAVILLGLTAIWFLNGAVDFGNKEIAKKWIDEGPYVFETDSSFQAFHISGDREIGFNAHVQDGGHGTQLVCFFPLDSTRFSVRIDTTLLSTPPDSYIGASKIFVLSDIESGYKTMKDFLITHEVVDANLDWTYGDGHLVLLGDFVDRGMSTFQVLWFIYMLEQKAKEKGGTVHFILGNHEIKNLQGNYFKASMKYFYAAAVLDRPQYELLGETSFLGQWMASKNTVEIIDGYLFTHGGLSPDLQEYETTLSEINDITRRNYRKPYFPKGKEDLESVLTSTTNGPAWYRGYFKSQEKESIKKGLEQFHAHTIVVGHTLQKNVRKLHDGLVYDVDVNHPKDYAKRWPTYKSQGLLIKDGSVNRLYHNGKSKQLNK